MESFLVVGVGRFGGNLAKTLYELGYQVFAIDENEERITKITGQVTHAVVGDAKDEDVLRSIGARNFDCAVVAMSDDIQASVLVTLMLKETGVPYVVAKATSEVHMRVLHKVGADKVVFPEKDMGMKLARALVRSNILEYMEMSDDFVVAEITVPSKWQGNSLRSMKLRAESGVNVLAYKKQGESRISISVDPDYIFGAGDTVVILASKDTVDRLSWR